MKAEIAKTERSSKNADIIILTTTDKIIFSGFATKQGKPTALTELKPGDIIEFDPVIKGQYKNIETFTKLGTTSTPAHIKQPEPKQAEISGPEHGMALKLVCDLYIAGKLKDVEPLAMKMWAELYRIMGVEK